MKSGSNDKGVLNASPSVSAVLSAPGISERSPITSTVLTVALSVAVLWFDWIAALWGARVGVQRVVGCGVVGLLMRPLGRVGARVVAVLFTEGGVAPGMEGAPVGVVSVVPF